MLEAGQPAAGVGCLDPAQGREDVAAGLVGEVGVGLGRFGVLLRVEAAVLAAGPAAVGFGAGDGLRSLGVALLVLSPDGVQLGDRLAPGAAVGARAGLGDGGAVLEVGGQLLGAAGRRGRVS